MRPVYENEFDRSNEEYIKDYLEANGEFTYEKSDPFAPIDGLLLREGKPVAAIEIKARTNASDKYPTYMISASKANSMLQISWEDNIMPLLVVRFTDGVFAVVIRKGYEKRLGGRYDRNDSYDVEPCVYIPMTEFKRLCR